MLQKSNNGVEGFFLMLTIFCVIIFILLVWAYYENSGWLTVTIPLVFALFMFSFAVTIQYTDGYSFRDFRWWYQLALPVMSVGVCVWLMVSLKLELNQSLVSSATNAKATFFTFSGDLVQAKSGVSHFFGHLLTISTSIWCGLACLYYLAEQKNWYGVADKTRFFSQWAIALIPLVIFSIAFVKG